MTPVEAARDVLGRVPAASCLVALSGGKDSLATLDLCCRHFAHVEAFFMYRVRGLRCETTPIEAAAKRHKVRVHYVPHWNLSDLYGYSTLRPYVQGQDDIPRLSQKHIEAFLRQQTGIDWFAYGERCSDSLTRNAKLKRFGGIDGERRRVYPVWRFSKADVYGYLHARKIPVPKMLGGGVYSGGVTLDAESLAWLQKYYPDDFAKVCEVFPFAPAMIARREWFGDPLDAVRNHQRWQKQQEKREQNGQED